MTDAVRTHTRLSLAEGWRAYRRTPHWIRKSLIGWLALMIPLAGPFFVMGYYVDYARRVAWAVDDGLPPVGDLGTLALRTVIVAGGTLLWALPLSAVVVLLEGLGFVASSVIFAVGRGDPVGAMTAAVTLWVIVAAVILVASIFWAPLSLSALMHFVVSDRMEAFFEFCEILRRLRGRYWELFWLSARVVLLSMGVTLLMGIVAGALMASLALGAISLANGGPAAQSPGAADTAVLLVSLLILPAEVLFYALVALPSFPVSGVVYHAYGRWARAAYGLAAPEAS